MTKRRMHIIVLCLLGSLVSLSAILSSSPSSAASSGFYFTTASTQLTVGSVFTVNLRLNTSQEVDSMHVGITYPTNLLEVADISAGAEPFEFARVNDSSTPGSIILERFSVTGAPAGVSGDNYVATITLRAKTAGNAQLAFDSSTAAVRGGATVATAKNPLGLTLANPAIPPTPPDPTPASTSTSTSAGTSTPGTTAKGSTSQKKTTSGSASSSQSTQTTPSGASSDPSYAIVGSDGQPADSKNSSGLKVKLILRDNNDHALRSARVELDNGTSATTNAAGTVTFDGLLPGQYPLTVSYRGQKYTSRFTVDNTESGAEQSKKILITIKKTAFIRSKLAVVGGGAILVVVGAAAGGWLLISRKRLLRAPRPIDPDLTPPDSTQSANVSPPPAINNVQTPPPATPGTLIQPKPTSDATKEHHENV